jgi:hypothetical protein
MVNAHEPMAHLVSPPNIGGKNAPNEVKVQDCTLDAEEGENATDGTAVLAAAVHDNRCCVFRDLPCPTHGARLVDLDDPSPNGLARAHKYGEIVEKEQRSVVQVRQAVHIVEVGREIGHGLGEMQKEMEYEADGASILDGGGSEIHEDRQGFAGVAQVGVGADCDGLKARDLDHRGLVQDNDLLPSLVPKVFEVACGDFRQE